MHKITPVCSIHRENGLCNAEELAKILLAIEPEVVFEESRPSDLWSLEAQAITKYRESKLFQRVSVDRYAIPENLFAETQRVFACVEQASQEYLVLNEEDNNSVHGCGFKYLNSVACATMMARISEIEEKTIIATSDEGLIRGLARWRHAIQSRDREMINAIYEYCRENVFDTGVFLVGAAHKTGIAREIDKHASTKAVRINWNVAYDGQV